MGSKNRKNLDEILKNSKLKINKELKLKINEISKSKMIGLIHVIG